MEGEGAAPAGGPSGCRSFRIGAAGQAAGGPVGILCPRRPREPEGAWARPAGPAHRAASAQGSAAASRRTAAAGAVPGPASGVGQRASGSEAVRRRGAARSPASAAAAISASPVLSVAASRPAAPPAAPTGAISAQRQANAIAIAARAITIGDRPLRAAGLRTAGLRVLKSA